MKKKIKILVGGSNGYIGTRLCQYLKEKKYDLETFERLNNDSTTTSEFVNEISGVSRQCSHKGMVEQQRKLMKQQMEQSDPKNML